MGAGILCICIGIIILLSSFKPTKVKKASYVKGEVCAREYQYIPGAERNMYFITVRYFVNSKEYYLKSQFSQSYIKDGTKILLKYNKQNPEECIIIPRGIMFIAVAFIAFGIYAIISSLK